MDTYIPIPAVFSTEFEKSVTENGMKITSATRHNGFINYLVYYEKVIHVWELGILFATACRDSGKQLPAKF